MNVDDMILVSVDDHVIEPADMFEGHLPDDLKDKAPKLVTGDDGISRWIFQDSVAGNMSLNAVVSWPKDEWGMDPADVSEMRPGCYDQDERIRDFDHNGILASMCFPTYAGFSGNYFFQAPDKDLSLRMLQAYNDWHIDEWCANKPGRFMPLAIPPAWDPQILADEIRRTAAKGALATTMPELPHIMGLPSYHDLEYWKPVFDAFCDTGTVMCAHIGQGFAAINQAPGAPIDNLIILATQVSAIAAQDLLWGGAFWNWPDLKVAWSEGGIGWIPFYLNRCDRHYLNQRWLGHDFGDKLPSDIFKEHSLACYISDPASLETRHHTGIETIAWECDYPHSDSVWPGAPEFLMGEFVEANVPDDEIHMITWENAARFFNYDPFEHIPREQATVGALRAQSPDVDETIRSRKEWKAMYEAAHASGS